MATCTLDRRLEQFQSKVQRQINLADDQIQRNQAYLDSLLGEIAGEQDRLRRFQVQSEQAEEKRLGEKRKHSITIQLQAARLTANHHAEVAELQERIKQENLALSREFEDEVENVDSRVQKKMNERVQPI